MPVTKAGAWDCYAVLYAVAGGDKRDVVQVAMLLNP